MTTPTIRWKVAFASPPERVFAALATEEGRRSFWAVRAEERDGAIQFVFPNGVRCVAPVRASDPPRRFELDYFGARTRFDIASASGGAILTLTAENVPEGEWTEAHAGWVAVLLAMKAYVDFGIDLRNGEASLSWDEGFIDP